jgi:hypothetical protein
MTVERLPMVVLPLTVRGGSDRATAAWAAALLTALARDEAAGRRPLRLTEPGLATWARFRGRLGARDLVALLFEDAAVLHRLPFDPSLLGAPLSLERLSEADAAALLAALPSLDLSAPSAEYVAEQARLLGLPSRLGRSELHVVKPHQRVLELPGTGGQVAHHLVSSQGDLTLRANFLVACASWPERALAGVVGLDLGAPDSEFVVPVEVGSLRDDSHPLRKRAFDFVVGLHPDKGGLYRVEEQLALWFSGAKILLV